MHLMKLLHQRWAPILGSSGRLDILASRLDEKLNAVFFRVTPSLEDMSQPRHVLAFFAGEGGESELNLSHELDMDALWRDFCVPTGQISEIRQLGDAVLHQEALPVLNVNDPAVSEQIQIMKEDLIATGGVGIAAIQRLGAAGTDHRRATILKGQRACRRAADTCGRLDCRSEGDDLTDE